jgi:hypothetical protein
MKKYLALGLIALTLSFKIYAQPKAGETLVFTGSYEISGMMTNIAQLTMQTELMQTSKKTYLHMSLEAATYSKWDSFFKIRDLYEAYADPATLKPSLYKRNIYEGGYNKIETYTFLPDGRTINAVWSKGKRPSQSAKVKVTPSTRDVVTLVYKLRTVDFSKMQPGQKVNFTIVFDQKEYPVWVKYIGRQTVSAGNLGKKECYKLSVGARTNKLKGVDKNLIWLSADNNRIPCLVKFSIPVGTGQLTLVRASGI